MKKLLSVLLGIILTGSVASAQFVAPDFWQENTTTQIKTMLDYAGNPYDVLIEGDLQVNGSLTVAGIVMTGDLNAAGYDFLNVDDITGSSTSSSIFNTNPTQILFGGAATDITMGSGSGVVTFNGDMAINGGDITSTATTFNLLNGTSTTINLGGAATSLNLGATTGTTTVANTLVVNGTFSSGTSTITGGTIDNTIIGATTPVAGTFTTLGANTSLVLQDPGAGTSTVTIQSPTLAGSYTLTLPTTDGGASEFLQTDGAGVLTWAAVPTPELVAVTLATASGASVQTVANSSGITWNIPVSGADAGAHTWNYQIDGNSFLNATATGNGAGGIGGVTLNLQSATYTAGVPHNAIEIEPQWTAEDQIHRAVLVNAIQNGSNSQSLTGLYFNLQQAGAGTLALWNDIYVASTSSVGTTTAKNVMYIADQTSANVITPRGINFATAGVANSIVWGGSALQYANGAENIRFMDSTNARGIGFTMTAAGNQTVAATGGTLVLTTPDIGAATGTSLLLAAGTVAAPSHSFSGATGAGMYEDGRLRFAHLGVNHLIVAVDGMTLQATDGLTITNRNSNAPTTLITINPYAVSASATTAERTHVLFNSASQTWATGAVANQRYLRAEGSTILAAGASLFSNVTNFWIDTPNISTNATVTTLNAAQIGGSFTINQTADTTYGAIGVPDHTATIGSLGTQITSAGFSALRLGQITLTSATVTTVDYSATLYVKGAPIQAGSVTITSPLAAWFDDGVVRVDGNIWSGPTVAINKLSTSTLQSAALAITAGDGTNIDSFRIRHNADALIFEFKENATDPTNLAESFTRYFKIDPSISGVYLGSTDLTYAYGGAFYTGDLPATQLTAMGQTTLGNFFANPAQTSATNSRNYSPFVSAMSSTDASITSVNLVGYTASPAYGATSAGTMTGVYGFLARPRSTHANATITTAAGFVYEDATATGNITNQYGVKIPSLLMGTNNYGVEVAYGGVKLGLAGTTDTIGFNMPTASVVLGNTTGTTVNVFGISLGIPTYTSTTNVRTVTNMANLYIAGEPVASTNVTATNGSYALLVDDGKARFDGYSAFSMGGTPTTGVVLSVGANNTTMPAATTAWRHFQTGGNVTELAGATITDIVGAYFNTFTVTDGGGAETVGIVANVYIPSAPTVGTTPSNGPYALFVGSGSTRFGGHIVSTQTTAPTTDITGTTLNDGAGSGAAMAVTAGSTDSAGSFTVTAGNGTPGAGFAGDILFNVAYGAAPKSVILTSKDADGTNNQIYATTDTAGFSVFFNTALGTSEVVEFFYWVIE